MIDRWKIGLDRSQKFALSRELKKSLLPRNLTNFPQFPLFSSLRKVYGKKGLWFISSFIFLYYLFIFFLIVSFVEQTILVEVRNTFFCCSRIQNLPGQYDI